MSKPCKYGCAQELTWDTGKGKFVENDGTEHTKERCAYMKSIQPKTTAAQAPATKQGVLEIRPESPNQFDQRQKDIALAHQDNLRIHSEAMAASKEQTAAMLALANELQGIKHLFEIAVNNSDVVKKTFTSAASLVKEKSLGS